jgi:hypothetical protein
MQAPGADLTAYLDQSQLSDLQKRGRRPCPANTRSVAPGGPSLSKRTRRPYSRERAISPTRPLGSGGPGGQASYSVPCWVAESKATKSRRIWSSTACAAVFAALAFEACLTAANAAGTYPRTMSTWCCS